MFSILLKANYRLRQLFPVLNKSSTTNINLALVIYKSLLCSTLTYASHIWGNAAHTYISMLQTFQNKVLKRVTPLVILHEQTGISIIRSHNKRLVRALYLKSVTRETARFLC
jgi:hypothetical protein